MSKLEDKIKRLLNTWEERLVSVNKDLRSGNYAPKDKEKLNERSKLYKELIRELEYILLTNHK